mmetsp:Transcript_54701/g.168471  ORF Transcript_54701/g.168471 Transcript_54701/m.168471 type:complete len:393 (-) Transcript_54701:284-1462(-)
MAWARRLHPSANCGFSKTPTGPFQMTVRASPRTFSHLAMVCGPKSSAMCPSGTSAPLLITAAALLFHSVAHAWSMGSTSCTSFFLASSTRFLATVSRSISRPLLFATRSTLESATVWPRASRKVKAMAPPMMMVLQWLYMLPMRLILSLTLEPPMMATTGLTGFCSVARMDDTSFAMRYPATPAPMTRGTPVMLAASRCAVPKASQTKMSAYPASTSAILVRARRSLELSAAWKRRFSSSSTSPFFILATSSCALRQSFAHPTGRPSSSSRRWRAGVSDMDGTTFPFGRPRWDIRIALPPDAMTRWIVRSVARMRLSSRTWPFWSIGTLKSTRMRTRFPFTSRSSSVIFFPSALSTVGWKLKSKSGGSVTGVITQPTMVAMGSRIGCTSTVK